MRCLRCDKELSERDFPLGKRGTRKKWCRPCCDRAARVAQTRAARDRRTNGLGTMSVGRCYDSRDAVVRSLGFDTYQDYLASDLWKRVRDSVFRVKGDRCCVCGKTATQVHHQRYNPSALRGDKLKQLWPVCRECHRRAEFDVNGRKKTMYRATHDFARLLKRKGLKGLR